MRRISFLRAGAVLLRDLPNVFPRMTHLWADAGYTGKLAEDIKTHLGWTLEIVKHPLRLAGNLGTKRGTSTGRGGAQGLKRRWVVERTFAWLGKSRRMAKDDEALVRTAENLVYEVMIRLMVRRLAKHSAPRRLSCQNPSSSGGRAVGTVEPVFQHGENA